MRVLFKSYRILNPTGNIFYSKKILKILNEDYLKLFLGSQCRILFLKVSFSPYRWNKSVTKLHGCYKLFMQSYGCLSYDMFEFFETCLSDGCKIVTLTLISLSYKVLDLKLFISRTVVSIVYQVSVMVLIYFIEGVQYTMCKVADIRPW